MRNSSSFIILWASAFFMYKNGIMCLIESFIHSKIIYWARTVWQAVLEGDERYSSFVGLLTTLFFYLNSLDLGLVKISSCYWPPCFTIPLDPLKYPYLYKYPFIKCSFMMFLSLPFVSRWNFPCFRQGKSVWDFDT